MIKVGDILKTRDGCQVEITEAGPDRLRGIVSLNRRTTWSVDGKWAHCGKHNMDLMMPEPERKSGWMNWYGTDNGQYIYRTRNDAEFAALSGRTHVLEIILEDNEPVDVKIHKVTK